MVTVGLIGVGNMGTPMAKNLLKSGYPVVVFDINAKQMDALAHAGARKAGSAKELAAQSDVVLTVLTWPKVVEDAVLGEGEVLAHMKEGATLIASTTRRVSASRKRSRAPAAATWRRPSWDGPSK
jgi:3-hydroxyisobutyrate dehydrogenase-like beta-hydroxyacid dehydrogenase